jgi:hypothetical protein
MQGDCMRNYVWYGATCMVGFAAGLVCSDYRRPVPDLHGLEVVVLHMQSKEYITPRLPEKPHSLLQVSEKAVPYLPDSYVNFTKRLAEGITGVHQESLP